MEERFGYEFSNVRIHNDSLAHQSSADINAKAYTHQNHIAFGQGQYQPNTYEGKELLAHELTHVIQQNNTISTKTIQRQTVNDPQKYADVINYKKATAANLDSWYKFYKFFDFCREEGIDPLSTPNFYADNVYELQLKLAGEAGTNWNGKVDGILEENINHSPTYSFLMSVAMDYAKDKSKDRGFNVNKLDRLYKFLTAINNELDPLQSSYFKDNFQLGLVNRNAYFSIHLNDKGDYVKLLQMGLLSLNYDLGNDYKIQKSGAEKDVTGVYGAGTKKAVENFQKDSGFEGKEIDGITGQVTLQLLDKRLGTAYYSGKAGKAFGFSIPVTEDMVTEDKAKQEEVKLKLLKQLLIIAFPVTEGKVQAMLDSGWHWTKYRQVSMKDVSRGYFKATVKRSEYEAIMGKMDDNAGTVTGDTVTEKLEQQAVALEATSPLYDLMEQIERVKAEISSERGSGDPEMHGKDVNWSLITELQAKLCSLERQRDMELKKLNLTVDDYDKQKAEYISMDDLTLQAKVQKLISDKEDDGVIQKISKTRERVREKPELIWEMPPVIARAKQELHVMENTIQDKIIMDAFKAHKETSFWKSLAFGALSLGVGLVALSSGPLGWVALGASIGLGAYDAYKTYEEITFKREATGSAVNSATALGNEDPSYFWFVVSLVSIGLDVYSAAKIVKTVKEGAALAENVIKALKAEKRLLKQN